MSESTTPVPAEAIEAAAIMLATRNEYPSYRQGIWWGLHEDQRRLLRESAEAALAAAAPILLAAERERIATAIEAEADSESARTGWDGAPGELGNWIGGIKTAAAIARTPGGPDATV